MDFKKLARIADSDKVADGSLRTFRESEFKDKFEIPKSATAAQKELIQLFSVIENDENYSGETAVEELKTTLKKAGISATVDYDGEGYITIERDDDGQILECGWSIGPEEWQIIQFVYGEPDFEINVESPKSLGLDDYGHWDDFNYTIGLAKEDMTAAPSLAGSGAHELITCKGDVSDVAEFKNVGAFIKKGNYFLIGEVCAYDLGADKSKLVEKLKENL